MLNTIENLANQPMCPYLVTFRNKEQTAITEKCLCISVMQLFC